VTFRTTDTEWAALIADIVDELHDAVTAVEGAMPVEYPGPELFNEMRDYMERLKALNFGLPVVGASNG